MRRKEKAVAETAELVSVLDAAKVLHVGFCDGGRPYVVPLSFGHDMRQEGGPFPGSLYIHSAQAGRKWELLRRGEELFFTAYCDDSLKEAGETACKYSMRFRSVMGTALPRILTDPEEKAAALDLIMKQYTGREGFSFPESSLSVTGVIRLEITSISGKSSGRE